MEQGEFKIAAPAKKENENATAPDNAVEKDTAKGAVENKPKTEEKVLENIQVIEEITGDNKGSEEDKGLKIEETGFASNEINKFEAPEGVDSLISFINETGGSIQDYARLNTNVEDMDADSVLREYYKKEKPHLTGEDLDFYIEDKFLADEDVDDDRTAKLKRIAYKEEVAKAKKYITDTKDKYYKEIKSKQAQVDPKAQEALDFFQRFKKKESDQKDLEDKYKLNSRAYLDKNEGFDFDLGNKKVKYKYKDADRVSKQSEIKNFVQKFVQEDGQLDFSGYHKAMYVANNADKMVKSFYEQGRADMAKEMAAGSKNITAPTSTAPKSQEFTNGMKFKVLGRDTSNDFRIKKRN